MTTPPPPQSPRALERALGLEVRRFVTEHHRRRLIPVTVHLGRPGGVRRVLAAEPGWDHALRTDLVLRLLDRGPPGSDRVLWLTRGGAAEVHDDDLAWLRAARCATASYLGSPLRSFAVVTRSGWHDLLTDRARTWARTRPLDPAVATR